MSFTDFKKSSKAAIATKGLLFILYLFFVSLFSSYFRIGIYVYLVPYIISLVFNYDNKGSKYKIWAPFSDFNVASNLSYASWNEKEVYYGGSSGSDMYNLKSSSMYKWIVYVNLLIKTALTWVFFFISFVDVILSLLFSSWLFVWVLVGLLVSAFIGFLGWVKYKEVTIKKNMEKDKLKRNLGRY